VSGAEIRSISNECFRCGYDLRGIGDDHPCPECGLLAARSRRVSDELQETRPRWLAGISRGTNLILLAILISIVWGALPETPLWRFWENLWSYLSAGVRWHIFSTQASMELPGWLLANAVMLGGVVLLTRPEGFAPADLADRRHRMLLRIAASMPLAGMLFLLALACVPQKPVLAQSLASGPPLLEIASLALGIIGGVWLPWLLFTQFRNLARRARRPDLAKYCALVAAGSALAILFIGALIVSISFPPMRWLPDRLWIYPSASMWCGIMAVGVVAGIFVIWGLFLLVGFSLAFRRAAENMRDKWSRDDRSLTAI
jgi:hypothetical protein